MFVAMGVVGFCITMGATALAALNMLNDDFDQTWRWHIYWIVIGIVGQCLFWAGVVGVVIQFLTKL